MYVQVCAYRGGYYICTITIKKGDYISTQLGGYITKIAPSTDKTADIGAYIINHINHYITVIPIIVVHLCICFSTKLNLSCLI